MNMTEQIFRVVIPEEEETQVKDGKAKSNLKTFPGYVLVELVMTDESWYVYVTHLVLQDSLVQLELVLNQTLIT